VIDFGIPLEGEREMRWRAGGRGNRVSVSDSFWGLAEKVTTQVLLAFYRLHEAQREH